MLARRSTLDVRGGAWTANEAQETGGGLAALGGRVDLLGVSVTDNVATVLGGGAFVAAELQASDGTWVGNDGGDGGGALAVLGDAPTLLVRNRMCGNRADLGGAVALGDEAGNQGTTAAVIQNNLIDAWGAPQAPVAVGTRPLQLVHNHVIRAGQAPAVVVAEGASLEARKNVFAYAEGDPLVQLGAAALAASFDSNAWWLQDAPVDRPVDDQSGLGLAPSDAAVFDDPRLWAVTVGDGFDDACRWRDVRHRPASPLDDDGDIDTIEGIGVFGGADAPAVDTDGKAWLDDADEDGVNYFFDCDDDVPAVGAGRRQFEDLDGDGIGGARVETDACTLLPGNVAEGGDCDDTRAELTEDCAVPYYGRSCGCAAGGVAGATAWLAFLPLIGLRRRR